VAEANVWTAAAAGKAVSVGTFLDEDPDLLNHPGPHGWTPLICACYSRVKPVDAAHSTFEVARLLLDRGADPNSYTMKGNADERLDQTSRRFTALTGLFGGGSTGMANQPPHPRWRDLAELLLDHGADPADEEALAMDQGPAGTYGKLETLLRHGLTPDARSRRPNAGGITLMGRALFMAAQSGDTESVQLLLAYHARTDESFRAKTPWQLAMERGHLEIARLLEEAGAPISELDDVASFVSACVAGDRRGAHAMVEHAPDLPARAPKDLVIKAVNGGRQEAVNLALDLGFDPDWMDEITALHMAAGQDREEIVRLLLKRGASLTLREPFYNGTAVGWADFFDQQQMRDLLLKEGAIDIYDALDYNRLDRLPEILARDPAAIDRPFAEYLSHEPRPEDWHTPLVRMVERGNAQAVGVLLEQGAAVTARHPDGRSLVRLARDQGFPEIAALLIRHGAVE
jgi:ankyrin repeat protein